MRKMPLLALLLILAVWSPALQNPSGDENKPLPPPGMSTLEGCLEYDNGIYSLLGNDGVKYRLAASSKLLKGHVGHEVELTGKPSSRTQDNTPPSGASSVVQYYVFEVKSLRHVSLNCKPQ